MDRELGSPDYWRVRLGIGHPGDKARVLGWVLGDFAKSDADWLDTLLDDVAAHAALLTGPKPEEFAARISKNLGEP
jgi:PTH1 family peptidyl-tRNA hydrolase